MRTFFVKQLNLYNIEHYDKDTFEYWARWFYSFVSVFVVFFIIPLLIVNLYLYVASENYIKLVIQGLIIVFISFSFFPIINNFNIKSKLAIFSFYLLSLFLMLYTNLTTIGFFGVTMVTISSSVLLSKKEQHYFFVSVFFTYLIVYILLITGFFDDVYFANMRNTYLQTSASVLLISVLLSITIKSHFKRHAENYLKIKNDKDYLMRIIESVDEAVITINKNMEIVSYNKTINNFTCCKVENYNVNINKIINIFIENDNMNFLFNEITLDLLSKDFFKETFYILKEDRTVYIKISVSPLLKNSELLGHVVILNDITKQLMSDKEKTYIGDHDTLTGLYNRGYLDRKIEEMDLKNINPVALIIGDINGLKMINDVYGHFAGDELIKGVSSILKRKLPRNSILARWGGDEFVICIPETSKSVALRYLNDALKTSIFTSYSKTFKLGQFLSVGIAFRNQYNRKLLYYLKLAEKEMYEKKISESKEAHNIIIKNMQETLMLLNIETKNHIDTVKDLSIKLANYLKVDKSDIDTLEMLCDYHDIGKIAINKEILLKEDKLDELEIERVQKHSEIGYQIARTSSDLIKISYLILAHHERFDGTGYPLGLKERNIPFLVRIFQIAHDYNTIVNDRSDRKAYSTKEAIQILKTNASIFYDPYLVDVFVNHII
ncbi:diguanylate cyclase [Candidatus Izimaplasma sp. ZiA1]|uniref:HD-GYP domain-containing protein n=1 Tax=Candidatus Izimoplasma sp. ZiA1 TaxID=2024899 RepID=UPI001438CBDE